MSRRPRHKASGAGQARAEESKQRLDAGKRLGAAHTGPRPYYCRNCGTETVASEVPMDWYSVIRSAGSGQKGTRLGLYCSIDCLDAMLPRLGAVAGHLREGWVNSTAKYAPGGGRPTRY